MTGACCFVDGSCQVLTQAHCTSLTGIYQGDGATCNPNPAPIPQRRTAPCARSRRTTPTAPRSIGGQWVHIHGICTLESNTWAPNRIEFTITDGECCTNVFNGGAASPVIHVGDEVDVIGTVGSVQWQDPSHHPEPDHHRGQFRQPDPGSGSRHDRRLLHQRRELRELPDRDPLRQHRERHVASAWVRTRRSSSTMVRARAICGSTRTPTSTAARRRPVPSRSSGSPHSSTAPIPSRAASRSCRARSMTCSSTTALPPLGACCFPSGLCSELHRSGMSGSAGATISAMARPARRIPARSRRLAASPMGPARSCWPRTARRRAVSPGPGNALRRADHLSAASAGLLLPRWKLPGPDPGGVWVQGGQAMGNGTVCDPNPCEQPPGPAASPTVTASS